MLQSRNLLPFKWWKSSHFYLWKCTSFWCKKDSRQIWEIKRFLFLVGNVLLRGILLLLFICISFFLLNLKWSKSHAVDGGPSCFVAHKYFGHRGQQILFFVFLLGNFLFYLFIFFAKRGWLRDQEFDLVSFSLPLRYLRYFASMFKLLWLRNSLAGVLKFDLMY